MALPSPPPYNQPIPNNPFYSPETAEVCTPTGTYVVGCGLGVCYDTGTLVALGDGAGTVQLINTGTGLTGGPITVSGTLALEPLAVPSTGSYTYPTALDVDPYGRVTSVTNGSAPVPASAYNALGAVLAGTGSGSFAALAPGALNQVLTADPVAPLGVKWEYTIPDGITEITGTLPIYISNSTGPSADVAVAAASLASSGVVQLNDSVASTSTTEAATPNAVKTAYDAAVSAQATADAAVPDSSFTIKGDLLVGSGAGTYGNLVPGADGQFLVADSVSIPGLKYTASLPQVTAPTASTDAGNEGEVASDATYFYFYTGGRWQRIAWDVTVW